MDQYQLMQMQMQAQLLQAQMGNLQAQTQPQATPAGGMGMGMGGMGSGNGGSAPSGFVRGGVLNTAGAAASNPNGSAMMGSFHQMQMAGMQTAGGHSNLSQQNTVQNPMLQYYDAHNFSHFNALAGGNQLMNNQPQYNNNQPYTSMSTPLQQQGGMGAAPMGTIPTTTSAKSASISYMRNASTRPRVDQTVVLGRSLARDGYDLQDGFDHGRQTGKGARQKTQAAKMRFRATQAMMQRHQSERTAEQEEEERKRYEREYLQSIGVKVDDLEVAPNSERRDHDEIQINAGGNAGSFQDGGSSSSSGPFHGFSSSAGAAFGGPGAAPPTKNQAGTPEAHSNWHQHSLPTGHHQPPESYASGQQQFPDLPPLPGPTRDVLPIDASASKIVAFVNKYHTVCVQGETGCGKSSRIPQYIYHFCQGSGNNRAGVVGRGNGNQSKKIIITQPRRLACTTLAKRVQQEMGEQYEHLVGYRIGGEASSSSADTKLLFVTTGYLLQLLINDPLRIRSFSHVILDEVHERAVDSDLLSYGLTLIRWY
eukprot:g14481.t1